MDYKVHAGAGSLYNTPPMYPIYICSLVLDWIAEQGGVEEMARRATAKASALYSAGLEASDAAKAPCVTDAAYRSKMNATFTIPDAALEKQFFAEAKARQFLQINGHRSVGGVRVSMYNAVPLDAVNEFAAFMADFAARVHANMN
ncbi:PLP-dependent transferase [Ramicandelaber brevisporus]|nr:PLP-dependent transferase [Ramicandelaber brevisporus]